MSGIVREHAAQCLAGQAWDIPEAQDHCSCEFPYPRRLCSECLNMPHQHKKGCARHPKAANREGSDK